MPPNICAPQNASRKNLAHMCFRAAPGTQPPICCNYNFHDNDVPLLQRIVDAQTAVKRNDDWRINEPEQMSADQ